MRLPETIRSDIESALAQRIEDIVSVAGGDINEAFRLTLSSGRSIFAKYHRCAPAGMFASEAHGLSLLAAGPLRVPEVVFESANFLLLEDLGSGPKQRSFDEELGRGLAALHSLSANTPGCPTRSSGYIATLPIDNAPARDWTSFYTHRLRSLIKYTELGPLRARLESVLASLDALLAAAPLALLHGDLWRGNVHTGSNGAPCLVDPSAYFGDPEVDLAMMRLFGGFSPRVFEAYQEVLPPRAGARRRQDAYQLYPILVHVALFGDGYLHQLDALLSRLE